MVRIGRVLPSLPLALWASWCAAAVLLGGGGPGVGRGVALLGLVALVGAVGWAVRSLGVPTLVLACLGVSLWFSSLEPRHDRAWLQAQSRMPDVSIEGDRFVVEGLRQFRYRSADEVEPHWSTEAYRFSDLQGADLGISRFSELEAMAHVFVSFRFTDGRVLVASAEVRKEQGESFSPIRGLFRQYEKIIVLGDERDLVELRAVHLGERVELHPLDVPRDGVEAFLRSVLAEVEALHDTPAWYHTVFASCSTSLSRHLTRMGALPWDHRVLFPGYADALAWELGWLGEGDLEALRGAHRVDERAQAAAGSEDFSERLRSP